MEYVIGYFVINVLLTALVFWKARAYAKDETLILNLSIAIILILTGIPLFIVSTFIHIWRKIKRK